MGLEEYMISSFKILTKHYLGDQSKNNEMSVACDMYGRKERFIQGFGVETWANETTWKI
jgi:hypothetical protein